MPSDMKSVVGEGRQVPRLRRRWTRMGGEESDIEAGIWVGGVGPRDPSFNVQRAGKQSCLRPVPLESPGERVQDVNRNRCDREGPRGGRLGRSEHGREFETRERRKKQRRGEQRAEGRQAGKRNATATATGNCNVGLVCSEPGETRKSVCAALQVLQRFCTQQDDCMALRPIGRQLPPRWKEIRCAGWWIEVG